MGRSKGLQRRSRSILRKSHRTRGKVSLGKLLHEYETGDKVVISINSGIHKSMPDTRYHGKTGIISEKRGRAYIVELQEGSKIRRLILRPEHIKSYENQLQR